LCLNPRMGHSPSASTTDRPLELGRYRVLEEVTRAAGSVVYKARDPLIDRLVILKTLTVGLPNDEAIEFRKRVDRELKSAGRLNHPNIVTIYDVGTSGIAYIAMDSSRPVAARMLRSGAPLMPNQAARLPPNRRWARFRAARSHHRNINPTLSSCLRNGVVKITDFGIARLSRGSHADRRSRGVAARYTSRNN
jgi:serine/threonine-protein kinase